MPPFCQRRTPLSSHGNGDPGIVGALAARVRPISARRDRSLPLLAPLAPLFPAGGLRRGTVVAVDLADRAHDCPSGEPTGHGAGGATTLAFALLAAASATGSWCAAVGTADPGILSMAELGIDLGHLAIVPLDEPGAALSRPGLTWPEVTAALIDGMDAVLVRPPWQARPHVARHLVARARERQTVLIVLSPRAWWPEGPDLHLTVTTGVWHGVGAGHGHLRGRRVEVVATGRRIATRPVHVALWLPAPSGVVAEARENARLVEETTGTSEVEPPTEEDGGRRRPERAEEKVRETREKE